MLRDNRLDSLKGFLIILVVLGHLIGELGGEDSINDCVHSFIYTFHMPLFVLLSGYFSKVEENKGKFKKGIFRIASPFVIFQCINIILLFIHDGVIDYTLLFIPHWTLWYLLSLIFWRFMLQFSPQKLLNNSRLFLSIALGISIICGLFPYGRILSIQRTLNFFPFFLFGYYMSQGLYTNLYKSKVVMFGIVLAILIIIKVGVYPENSNILLKGADQYVINQIPAKMFILICSFVTSYAIFYLFAEIKFLSRIGRESLFYYVYHGIIIEFLIVPMVNYFALPTNFIFMIAYCLSIVMVLYIMDFIPIFKKLTNPLLLKN